jgi:predicted  nucleic acid-binding Zn-ribbon protein
METLMAQTTIETPADEMTAVDWLSTLEEKVRAAAERIRGLQSENAALRGRLAEMEQQLAAAPGTPPEAARWEEEKREIRDRVERLTRHLEDLAGV